jgi:YD repeat-containing protein
MPGKNGYVIKKGEISDVSQLIEHANHTIQLDYHSGWYKKFKLFDTTYHLVSVGDNFGNQIQLNYTDNKLDLVTGQNGHFIEIIRNDEGLITEVKDDNNRRISYQYDNQGRLIDVTDLGAGHWKYQYKGNKSKLTKVIDPQNNIAATFQYYNNGKVKHSKVRSLQNTYQYQKNETFVTNDSAHKTQFKQNDSGITTSVVNAEGHTSTVLLNENNQVDSLYHNGQFTAQLSYDSKGKINKTNQKDHDNLIKTANTIHKNDTYRYNAKGDIVENNTNQEAPVYSYNDDGLLTEITDKDAIAKFTYNALGKLTSVTFPDGNRHNYEYDSLGLRIKTKRSNGTDIDYSYDTTGNLKGLINTNPKGDIIQEEIMLDQDHKVKQVIVNGVSTMEVIYNRSDPESIQVENNITELSYDKTNRLTQVNKNNTDANPEDTQQYDYQNGEQDIRIQLDDRTAAINTPFRKTSRSMAGLNSTLYTRSSGMPWKNIIWDETLGNLMLASTQKQKSDKYSSYQRRRLYDALSINPQQQIDFDKPSNSYFLPPEYVSINCEPSPTNCWVQSIEIDGPTNAEAGQEVTFLAKVLKKNCIPKQSFYVRNKLIKSGTMRSFSYSFGNVGLNEVKIVSECDCGGTNPSTKTAIKTVTISAPPTPPKKVKIAFTFDDGPHIPTTGSKTNNILNTLKVKGLTHNKSIKATFYVEYSRINNSIGRSIISTMKINGHEVAIHGVDSAHHKKHQDTTNLLSKLNITKEVISASTGISASNVRPPYGWSWPSPPLVYSKDQVSAIYAQGGLTRYQGTGENGANSWWGGAYSTTGTCSGCVNRFTFIGYIKTKIDMAVTASTPPDLVLLMHDVRTDDMNSIGGIIDEIETYADSKNVQIEYSTMNSL